MIFGGSSTSSAPYLRPVGAEPVAAGRPTWKLGDGPVRVVAARGGRRHVLILGWCGASSFEVACLADSKLPDNIAWRWPGTYTVVEETTDCIAVYTDPASARPVYMTSHQAGWAWSSSARLLAALRGSDLDAQRLICSIMLPSVPALAGTRTFFAGVEQLPPGSRVELPTDGTSPRYITLWRPDPEPTYLPGHRLREALTSAVLLRTAADPTLSCDLSGGLDSTSITVLAATALPPENKLNAVTIHPEGNQSGADLRYARLAADAYPNRVAHHLLPMTAEHRPYTGIIDVPPTDEPAPSTLTQTRLTGQLHWMRKELGTRTHLTGDGGDSVLFQPPIRLADLIRHRRWGQATSEAFGWSRLRRGAVLPLLRDAAAAARISRDEALAQLIHEVGTPGRNDHGHVRWFPLQPFPEWAEPPARRLLVSAAAEVSATPDSLPGLDASLRTLVDEVREVARSATADTELAALCGIDLQNPFLDATVMDAVLRTPLGQRSPVHTYKPLLALAMADVLPPAVATRSTKGSFEADHYAGMRANLPSLLDIADGHLAQLGLISPARFRRALREAAAGIPMPLATIEQALAAEAWLTAHYRAPAPTWTSKPARRERD